MSERERASARATAARTPWVWLAWATPVVVAIWVLQPRIATSRPSYGFRETMLDFTVLLAVPCIYAIGRLARRQAHSASWQTTVQRWLWSATIAFASLPVVLSVAGDLVHVPGSYHDDQIPGFSAGVVAAAMSVVLAVISLSWMAMRRAVPGNRPSRGITRAGGAGLIALGAVLFVAGGGFFAFVSAANGWVRLFVIISLTGLLTALAGIKNVVLPSSRHR